MQIFTCILLGFLLVCAISVSLSKNLLNSILIYMSYSLVMSIIWIVLESPDLAITEAAVGAGVTSILFFVTLKKIHAIMDEKGDLDGTFDMEDAPEESGSLEKPETLKEEGRPEKPETLEESGQGTLKKSEMSEKTRMPSGSVMSENPGESESGDESGSKPAISHGKQKNTKSMMAGTGDSDRSRRNAKKAAKGGKVNEPKTV